MKPVRWSLAVALGLGLLVGCDTETKVKQTETIKTPEGSRTTTTEKKVETSGENPPPAGKTTP